MSSVKLEVGPSTMVVDIEAADEDDCPIKLDASEGAELRQRQQEEERMIVQGNGER